MATALSLKFFVLLLSILATFVMAQDCGYCKNCMKARTEQIRDYESQSILAKVSQVFILYTKGTKLCFLVAMDGELWILRSRRPNLVVP